MRDHSEAVIVELQIKQLVWMFCNEMKLQGRNAALKGGIALGIVNLKSYMHRAIIVG